MLEWLLAAGALNDLAGQAVRNKGISLSNSVGGSPRWCEPLVSTSRGPRFLTSSSVHFRPWSDLVLWIASVVWILIKRVYVSTCSSYELKCSNFNWIMSKLPIAAFYPNGSPSFLDAHSRNSTHNRSSTNRTIPAIILADSNNNLPSPVTLCVDGVLLWLLLAWLTAGTAAIITLLIKSCRNRYCDKFYHSGATVRIYDSINSQRWKHVDEEGFDWGGLDDSRSRSTKSQRTRSTSCSSVPSMRNAIPTPKPTTPSPNRFRSRSSSQHTSKCFYDYRLSSPKLNVYDYQVPDEPS